MEAAALKARLSARVDELAETLLDASHDIHAHPELCFEEHHAHSLLTEILERQGLHVTRSAFGLETAFEARVGTEGPDIGVCCEYDALPGVGHACGHNIIAAAGLGAGLAAAALADEVGCRVRILGTPAEEGGAGKQYMADAGAFDDLAAAMMVHPADADLLWMDTIALVKVDVEWFGEAAHAAAFPWKGRNALDAAVLAYSNIAALRQHIEPTDRIHGIFTDGGQASNVVPEHAAMEWLVRSATATSLEPLHARVAACWEAGATATGCRCEHRVVSRPYADMVDNPVLGRLYAANAEALGRPVQTPSSAHRVLGSTDMGNVSYLVPSIHPMIKVAPAGVSIHTHDFAEHARSAAGDEAVILGAKAMAMTIADLWSDASLLTEARRSFDHDVSERKGP
ncbi:MAG: M20 family metallopeptidase [Acidobacteria bacterium]|nr:M20 family metallopeptidase [Acidobacteriota bacterium]